MPGVCRGASFSPRRVKTEQPAHSVTTKKHAHRSRIGAVGVFFYSIRCGGAAPVRDRYGTSASSHDTASSPSSWSRSPKIWARGMSSLDISRKR